MHTLIIGMIQEASYDKMANISPDTTGKKKHVYDYIDAKIWLNLSFIIIMS